MSLISLNPSRSMISTDSGLRSPQRIGHRHLEAVLKQRAVRQIGEAVVVGEMADTLFGLRPLAPDLGIAQLAVDGRNQPVEIVLDDVIVGAVLHRLDGDLLADRARHENERHFEAAVAHHRQRRRAAEAGHRVIGDHEIPVVLVERVAQRLGMIDARVVGLVPALTQILNQRASRRSPSPQPAAVSVVACSRLPGDPGVRTARAVWRRISIASASFRSRYFAHSHAERCGGGAL